MLLETGTYQATRRPQSARPLLDLFDSRLQDSDLPLQLGKIAFDDLAPTALIGKSGLDPPERLRDRLVFLLEPLESPVDLVEVSEHVVSKLAKLTPRLAEPNLDAGESAVGLRESAVDLRELAPEKLHELLVLACGHTSSSISGSDPAQVCTPVDIGFVADPAPIFVGGITGAATRSLLDHERRAQHSRLGPLASESGARRGRGDDSDMIWITEMLRIKSVEAPFTVQNLAGVERNRGPFPLRILVDLVAPALADERKPRSLKDTDRFARGDARKPASIRSPGARGKGQSSRPGPSR